MLLGQNSTCQADSGTKLGAAQFLKRKNVRHLMLITCVPVARESDHVFVSLLSLAAQVHFVFAIAAIK